MAEYGPPLSGYAALGPLIRQTDKAQLHQYHSREVWVPKSLIEEVQTSFSVFLYAPTWAVQRKIDAD